MALSQMVCTACGTLGTPKVKFKGNWAIELLLYFFMILPGLIYSAWRSSGAPKVCQACGSSALVPPDSPVGKKLLGK